MLMHILLNVKHIFDIIEIQLFLLTGYTDRSSIGKIEKGEVDIPQSKIILFAKALGVSASELMGDDGAFEYIKSIGEVDVLIEPFPSRFRSLSEFHQHQVLDYINFLLAQEQNADEPQKDS